MTLEAFIFLFVFWPLATFTSGNSINDTRFFLGCQATIPCQHKTTVSTSFKWFYKKDEHSKRITIFSEDSGGVPRYDYSRRRGSVGQDRAFIIKNFTENDQGLYWCENCDKDTCREKSPVIRVTKEIFTEIHDTVYVIAGNNFTYSCPGEFINFKWTFNPTAFGKSAIRPETDFVTNKTIHIVNVNAAHAGKYTCRAEKCNGHRQKISTVKLCVVKVNPSGNSYGSCAVLCQMEYRDIKPNTKSNNVAGIRTVSVHVNPYGSLNCSAKQMYNADPTISSTHAPSSTSVKTTATPTQRVYLRVVIYGTTAVITSLILLAFFVFYFQPRMRADAQENYPNYDNIGTVQHSESTVVYSSVVFRTPVMTASSSVHLNDCVYSEVKFTEQ